MINYIQEVIVNTICDILNRYTYDEINSEEFQPVLQIVRNALVRQYPEHPDNKGSTWQDIESYKQYFFWSPRAVRAYRKAHADKISKEKEIALSKSGILHFEHIVPNNVILEKLLNLKATNTETISIEEVKKVLEQSSIIILSKEEAKRLDGNQSKHYEVEGIHMKGCGMRSRGERRERLEALGIDKVSSFSELMKNEDSHF